MRAHAEFWIANFHFQQIMLKNAFQKNSTVWNVKTQFLPTKEVKYNVGYNISYSTYKLELSYLDIIMYVYWYYINTKPVLI